MRHWTRFSIITLACLFISPALFGLPKSNINTQLYRPSLNGKGLVTNESGDILRHLKWTVSLHFNWSSQPVRVEGLSGKPWLISDRVASDIGFAIGLFDWIELGLNVPATLYQNGFRLDDPLRRIRKTWLLGDTSFYAKVRILQPEQFNDIALNVQLGISFPTADPNTAIGDRSFVITPSVNLSYDGLLYASLNLGFAIKVSESTFQNIRDKHDLRLNLGLGYSFKKIGLTLFGEFNVKSPLKHAFSRGEETPLELGVGTIWKSEFGLHVLGGVSLGVGKGLGEPAPRVFVGFRYTNDVGDIDNDGIPDKDDSCPKVPEDRDNFEDHDGCPEPDNDKDGVLDKDDSCPNKPGPRENRGCPWGDKDGDGVTDNLDRCPNKPGPRDNKGCPWGDKDRDGLADNVDKCPNKPGPRDNNGCPWGDKDGDGVTDNVDRCPDKPGPSSNKGCPIPTIKSVTWRVFFANGSATLTPKSKRVLALVANTLKANPKARLQIEGHTSRVGSGETNTKLSLARAQAVARRLVGVHKIDVGRLSKAGYGFTRPLATGTGEEVQAKNRRVELKLIR